MRDNKKKLLLIVLILAVVGIVFSTMMLENYNKKFMEEIAKINNINVNIHNVTEQEISSNVNGDDVDIYLYKKQLEPEVFIPEGVRITSDIGLNIRQEPTTDAPIVSVLEYGDVVIIEDKFDHWYKTKDGFIYKEYTEVISK